MNWINDFSRGRLGRWVLGAALLVAVVAATCVVVNFFGASPAAAASRNRPFVCAETGKMFNHELERGETVPIRSPYSGQNTGYPAELCYWTSDGQPRETPVGVLLNESVGKAGPTFCPDCGRLVVGHNPAAQAGATPPPTREKYAATRSRSDSRQARADTRE